jgi:hypothetical protein
MTVADAFIGRLMAEPGLEIFSANMAGDEAVINLGTGGDRVILHLARASNRPHYCKTARLMLYYEGGDLKGTALALVDRAARLLREVDARRMGGTAAWPPDLPAAPARNSAGRLQPWEGGPVTVNRWKNPRTGAANLEITLRTWDRCNQRCVFCQVEGMRWGVADETIREAIVRHGAPGVPTRLNLSGGEPTLNPRLAEYVRLALDHAYTDVIVQTNAVRFAAKASVGFMPISERLQFFVSLHGFDEKTYDGATRTVRMFPKAVAGIGNLLEAGHRVMLNVVFTSENLEAFPAMIGRVPGMFPIGRDRLSLNFSTVGSFPALAARSEVLPRLTDVRAVTRRAIREADRIGLEILDFDCSGFCSLPPCILSAKERSALRAVADNPEQAFSSGGYMKPETCKDCGFNSSCPGVPAEYAGRWGTGEFKPVKE